MDSRFSRRKDPIRNPMVQKYLEQQFKQNYLNSLKLMKVEIVKFLKEIKSE